MASKQQLSFLNLFLLWFGASVSVAEILTGGFLAELGPTRGLLAILLGHAVGTSLLVLGGIIGFRERLPSIMSTRISFGRQGSYLISLINILQLIGWTAVMVFEGGTALNMLTTRLWGLDSRLLMSALLGAGIGFWIFMGIRGFKIVNMVAVTCLLGLTIVMSVVLLSQPFDWAGAPSGGSFALGIELSVIMPLSWFPLIADYTSMSTSRRAAWLAPFLGYFLGSTWMYAIGLLGGIVSCSADPSQMMLAARLGMVALAVVGLSTVTTTFLDVYSAGVSLANVFSRINVRLASLVFTALGTVLAMALPITRYVDFLYLLGSVFAPLIAVLLADYFLLRVDHRRRRRDLGATLSLVLGIAFYHLVKSATLYIGPTLATIAFTFVLHMALRRLLPDRSASLEETSG
ncbi:MAG: putative hydroxymethylpyrimidine transporter CytX [Desulfohalobiaceae bacterium]